LGNSWAGGRGKKKKKPVPPEGGGKKKVPLRRAGIPEKKKSYLEKKKGPTYAGETGRSARPRREKKERRRKKGKREKSLKILQGGEKPGNPQKKEFRDGEKKRRMKRISTTQLRKKKENIIYSIKGRGEKGRGSRLGTKGGGKGVYPCVLITRTGGNG